MKIQHYAGRQDPFLELFWKCARESGLSIQAISNRSGVSKTTLYAWKKKTKRPQRLTLEFAFRACGFCMTISQIEVKTKSNVVPFRRRA